MNRCCVIVGLFAFQLVACGRSAPVQKGAEELAAEDSAPVAPAVGEPQIVENVGDGLWADQPDALRLVFEQAYGVDATPDDAILGNPVVLRYFGTASGEVYAQDGQRSRLVKFRSDGTVAWAVGRSGRGPGEFSAVTGLALSPDGREVAVSMFDGRLDYWSTEGEFLRSEAISPELGIPGVLAGFAGEFAIFRDRLPQHPGARVIVARPDALDQAMSFEIVLRDDVSVPGRAADVRPFRSGIASGSTASYDVRFYTAEGALLRRVTRDVDYPAHPARSDRTGRTSMLHNFGRLAAPIPLPNDLFLVFAAWEHGVTDPVETALARGTEAGWADPEVDWRASLDLFDGEGRFLQSIVPAGGIERLGPRAYPAELGSIGNSAGVDGDGAPYLYTLSPDPFPQIRRYRIELDVAVGRR